MTRLTTLAKRLFNSNIKTLIKAGFLNKDLSVTERGQAGINAVILESHMEEVVKLAEERIEEDKEEGAC
jgi:hypothetical protein